MELIATFLTEYPEVTFAGYHARLEKEKRFVLTDPEIIHRTSREISLEAVLQSQWKQIKTETAKKVLLAAGQFPALDAIPLPWLGLLTGLPAETEPGYPSPLTVTLTELTNISLATRPQPDTLHLHPLVREFAARQIPPSERDTFRGELENHLLETLTDPEHKTAHALTAGELLLRLPWSPTLARLPVLEALREQVNQVRQPRAQRVQAALHLTRLNWFAETSHFSTAVKAEELLEYLELVVRVVRTPEYREAMVNAINDLLEDRQITVLNRVRAQLLVHRAGLYGYLQRYAEARRDYQMSQWLYSAELERSHNPEDHKTLARIYFGLGNLANLDAETAPPDKKPQHIQEAIDLFQKARQSAQMYGKDNILEAIILRQLSESYLLLQDWPRADECLAQAQVRVADNPFYKTRITETLVERHLEEGKALAEAGQPAEAQKQYTRAQTLAQQNIETLLTHDPESEPIVVAYLLAGDCAQAIHLLTPTASEQAKQAREYWNAAQTLAEKLGDTKRAADALHKLTTLPPKETPCET
ncbi:MAG TPA: hypothetical protein PK530_05740 [Anaerolineales bacterium]|nr:hypothetical protein [Anaerolineales bacterium]